MDNYYYCTLKRPCPHCGGTRTVEHPDWVDFFEAHAHQLPDQAGVDEWFRNRGYDAPPPQETDCLSCDGLGYTSQEALLVDAMRALGFIPDAGK